MYKVVKTFTHALGLSCAFRQWRAESHCKFIHGYALQVEITFRAKKLDARNWVIDFGDFGELKGYLEELFDHKLVVAEDDPHLVRLKELAKCNVADVVVLENVGCEAFAKQVYLTTLHWLDEYGDGRVRVESVKISEHGGNSAIYARD